MNSQRLVLLFVFCLIFTLYLYPHTLCAAESEDVSMELRIERASPEIIEAWREMRFGMFIHWGPVTLSGKEIGWSRASETTEITTDWKTYDQFYRQFNPGKFNADEWMDLAKQAGVKYVVFTTKHHDGFCMWDTQYTDYDIMSSPFGKDVVKEITEACRRKGLRFGPYFSVCDWYQPDYGYSHRAQPGYTLDREPDRNRYVEYLKNQVKELHSKFGPFHVFWFDGEWEEPWTHELGVMLNNFCRDLQPDALVNNRVDKGRNDMEGMFKPGEFAGDYGTPEQRVGLFNRATPWETCMTIGTQWSWLPNDQVKSASECIKILVYTVGGDGNLLLNVSPTSEGVIEPQTVDCLQKIGAWLEQYGEGIYGTRGGPFMPGEWGASTCKGNAIYLFLYQPEVRLPLLRAKIEMISSLSRMKLVTRPEQDHLVLKHNSPEGNDFPAVVKITLDRDAEELTPVKVE